MSPYRLVYGKPCHLPIELEHKVYWVIQMFNSNIDDACKLRKLQISELEELRNDAYENSKFKKLESRLFMTKRFQEKYFIWSKSSTYNSRLYIFSGKLRSRWNCLFVIKHVYSYEQSTLRILKMVMCLR